MAFSPITDLIRWRLKSRIASIEKMKDEPHISQKRVLKNLLAHAENTVYGKKYRISKEMSYEKYQESMPIVNYETLTPWIERTMKGEQNLLWDGPIQWFAKSSGTTNSKSKFIPVSHESLDDCHLSIGKDLLAIYTHQCPQSQLFDGLSLRLGGSSKINGHHNISYYGDLSAIMIQNLPFWAEWRSTPSNDIALLEDWEEKVEKISHQVINQNVTSLFGVPSWMLVLIRHVLSINGNDSISSIWPNLELFCHGGVSFTPYSESFKKLLPDNCMFLETYNASEGFFAIQDRIGEPGMLLMLDHGVYYEFIPLIDFNGRTSKAINIEKVKTEIEYAVIISTNGGLWRYILGDTIRFISLNPYRIEVTGRTRHFINSFGEELVIENADRALMTACKKTNSEILDYTAAPLFMEGKENGAHQWLIEFAIEPDNYQDFATALDNELKNINSDYEAKRHKNMILRLPIIIKAEPNTFHKWLKFKGKLGGQNKVPRLSNDRQLIEEILKFKLSKT